MALLLAGLAAWTVACGSREAEDPQVNAWKRHRQEGQVAFEQGRHGQAEASWQQALDLARIFPAQDLRLRRTLDDLARLYAITGRTARAESLYTELLDLQRQIDPDGQGTASTLDCLADIFRSRNELTRAETLYVRLLALQEAADPPDPDISTTLAKLANLYGSQNRFLAADSLVTRAMALKLHHQGYMHFVGRRNRQAETFYRRALAVQEKKLGHDHPDLARTCYDLGLLCELQENLAEAERFYRRALAVQEKNSHPELPQTLCQLAELLEKTDRSPEAKALRERATTIRLHGLPARDSQ